MVDQSISFFWACQKEVTRRLSSKHLDQWKKDEISLTFKGQEFEEFVWSERPFWFREDVQNRQKQKNARYKKYNDSKKGQDRSVNRVEKQKESKLSKKSLKQELKKMMSPILKDPRPLEHGPLREKELIAEAVED